MEYMCLGGILTTEDVWERNKWLRDYFCESRVSQLNHMIVLHV